MVGSAQFNVEKSPKLATSHPDGSSPTAPPDLLLETPRSLPLAMHESLKDGRVSTVVGRACGKIIISGNVAVKFGRKAIAVPVDMFITVKWRKSDNPEDGLHIVWPGKKSDVWITTVRKITKLIETRIGPVYGTLNIANTLPLGKGMGSSTAIVIALARCLLGEKFKNEALAIEDIINPGHSGIDFATIWEERPISITRGRYEYIELPKSLQHGYLVDTGRPAVPTSIIIKRLEQRSSKEKNLLESVKVIGDCTERLLQGEDPHIVFRDHHRGQVNLGVVPPRVKLIIEKIQRSGGAAKAARSGGDTGGVGMVFAVHPRLDVLRKVLGNTPIVLDYDPLRQRFYRSRSGTRLPKRN